MIPHFPQVVANLLDEPYLLRMEDIKRLTPRQIVYLYMRPRDEKGIPRPLPYGFDDTDPMEEAAREFSEKYGVTLEKARGYLNGEC